VLASSPSLRSIQAKPYDGKIVEGSQVENEVLNKVTSKLNPETSFKILFLP